MNPLTNVKNINKINEIELAKGTVDKKSWHDIYKESAWIFIGGLTYGMTEGDIICVFSQYGEIVNINLVRDQKTGKTKGFCFLCYANQKSTVLAVDNLNGIKLCGRTIRVDHVANYKPPKDNERDDEITKQLKNEGCAPKPLTIENSSASDDVPQRKKSKKSKKEKKKHKKRKKENDEEFSLKKVKKERPDPSYFKYEFPEKLDIKKHIKRSDSVDGASSSDESSDTNSKCNSRKRKGQYKSRPESSRVQSDVSISEESGKSGPSKLDKTSMKRSDYRRKGSNDSSSDSDHEPRGKKSQNVRDHINGSFSESRDLKSDNYRKRKNYSHSPPGERYDKRGKDHKNKLRKAEDDYKNSSSSYEDSKSSYSSNHKRQSFEHQHHDSSDDTLHQQNSKTLSRKREKHRRNDSAEIGSSSHENKRLESNRYSSYQDGEGNDWTYQKKDHHHREQTNSRERYQHHNKSKDDRKDYRHSQSERKER